MSYKIYNEYIYFIINCSGNHKNIVNSGSGASEFLFYINGLNFLINSNAPSITSASYPSIKSILSISL
jgi:hypothetical protein